MNTKFMYNEARRPAGSGLLHPWLVLSLLVFPWLLGALVLTGANYASAAEAERLFAPPPPVPPHDEVLLVSTREIGTTCDSRSIGSGLTCQMLVVGATGQSNWVEADWRRLASPIAAIPTIIYVHGNRVATGQDKAEGLQVYQSFRKHRPDSCPVRFVIWSWPASQIPGPIKDYVVKAQRTNPAAWQLAWVLDKLPVQTPIALVGYSYGTRVVCGATHILSGGRLGSLTLEQRVHTARPPVRAALMAAAFDADWIQPGQYYSRSLSQIERLVLATNERDPAMRFYHLSNGRGRMDALGKSGVDEPRTLGIASQRLQRVDFTREVGRSHVVFDYLAAEQKMELCWRQLLEPENARMASTTFSEAATPYANN